MRKYGDAATLNFIFNMNFVNNHKETTHKINDNENGIRQMARHSANYIQKKDIQVNN
jgi:hypothetical protein